ncbi:MAG: hypothetical protein LBP39_00430 [Rickettsiales bacterium]|nr:hypothetical protein [Rickettsiales bacterium]
MIGSCESCGASDSKITNIVCSDLSPILKTASIETIFSNGSRAYELYQKYQFPRTNIPIVKLPPTNPANVSCNLEKLVEPWRYILGNSAYLRNKINLRRLSNEKNNIFLHLTDRAL